MANKVEIVVSALDRTTKVLRGISGEMVRMGEAATRASKIASVALAGISVAGGAVGLSMIKAAAGFQQSQIALETMLGSTEKADKLLKELADFARTTPFTLTGIEQSTKQLLAYGIASEDVMKDMKTLGDIAAGVGTDKLPQLILAFGQVGAATRLRGQELRQFTEAGVPLLEELSKALGKTPAEIQKLVSAGQIGFPLVRAALQGMSEEGGRFFDLMDKQSRTIGGLWSNLGDAIELFMRDQGMGLIDWTTDILNALIQLVDTTIPNFVKLIKETASTVDDWSKALGVVAGIVVGILTPALIAVSVWVGALVVALIPFAIGGAIIGGLIAGSGAFDDMTGSAVEFFKTVGKIAINFPEIWRLSIDTVKGLFSDFFDSPDIFLAFLSNMGRIFGALLQTTVLTITELAAIVLKASSVIWSPMVAAVEVLGSNVRFQFDSMLKFIKEKILATAIFITDKLNILLPKALEFDATGLEAKLKELEKKVITPAKTFAEAWKESGKRVEDSFASMNDNIDGIKEAFLITGNQFKKTAEEIGGNKRIETFLNNTATLLDVTQSKFNNLNDAAQLKDLEIAIDGMVNELMGGSDTVAELAKATDEEVNKILGDLKFLTKDFGRFWAEELTKNVEILRKAGVDENAINLFVADQRKALVKGTNEAIIQNSKETTEILTAMWQNHSLQVGTTAQQTAVSLMATYDTFKQGVGDAIASVITTGEDLGEALENVFKNVAASIISALIQIGIERIAQSLLGQALATKEASQKMAVQSGLTFASTFASVMASVPFPFNIAAAPAAAYGAVGAMLGGAAVAGGAGAAAGAALGGIAHAGLENVPQDSTFLLKKGERVLSPEQNKDLQEFMKTGGGGGVVIKQLNIMPDAQIDEALMNKPVSWWVMQVRRNILPAMNELGKANFTTTLRYKKTQGV